MGNLLYIKVHAAGISDTNAGRNVIYQTLRRYFSIRAFCGDMGYRGITKNFVENDLKMRMDITSKDKSKPGFQVIPTRWVVERYFAWLGNFRRFSKDFELLCVNSEQLIFVASIMMLLKRLF